MLLGIDVGSTTTKLALIGEDGALLHTYYSKNQGSFKTTVSALRELYQAMPNAAQIVNAAVTGMVKGLFKQP